MRRRTKANSLFSITLQSTSSPIKFTRSTIRRKPQQRQLIPEINKPPRWHRNRRNILATRRYISERNPHRPHSKH
ncbi:hypothetical protein HanIR_Chr03g0140371 [Helianthus annuus]|nr:hypothetical protein HanIR_Chr03g0140371 [Helianthus annuus]